MHDEFKAVVRHNGRFSILRLRSRFGAPTIVQAMGADGLWTPADDEQAQAILREYHEFTHNEITDPCQIGVIRLYTDGRVGIHPANGSSVRDLVCAAEKAFKIQTAGTLWLLDAVNGCSCVP